MLTHISSYSQYIGGEFIMATKELIMFIMQDKTCNYMIRQLAELEAII
jgi:hypothetical protein